MHRFKYIVFVLLVVISACGLFENFDEIPMFVELKDPTLLVEANEGTDNHRIRDIWVSADGQSLGVFEMPVTIPVLDDNSETTFSYFAGIHRNGSVNDHVIYPFYRRIDISRPYQPNETIEEDLEFSYVEDAVFEFVEDFENNHIFTQDVDGSDTSFVDVTNIDCEEGFCGLVTLSPEVNNIEFATVINFTDLPVNGTPVYLEMDFKTEVNLRVGLQANFGGAELEQYLIVLLPADEWKKVYLDFSELLVNSQLGSYRVVMSATHLGDEPAEIRLDNVKLIHF